MSKKVIRLLV